MKRTRWVAVLTAVTVSAFAAGGCATARPGPPADLRPVVLTASQVATLRALGLGDTAFGLSLLARLCSGQPGSNLVLSPVSMATGLGMAYLGARGATAAAMARTLHLPATGPGLVAGLSARSALLRSLDRPGVTFAASNRIWADPSLPPKPSFVTALRAGYQAALRQVPLLSRTEQARRIINAAIAAETAGHIGNLLPPGSLTPPPGWILTDALYLNALWANPFDHSRTSPGPFSTAHGQVSAEYLNGGEYAMAKASGWTAVSLPYRGRRLEMLALLPAAGRAGRPGGCQVPRSSTIGALVTQIAASRTRTGISLPKIRLAGSESMRDVLTALGMGIAFTSQADFTGLSSQACCIAFVQHAATLAVGERGTVASAATAVGIFPTAGLAVTLRFDRPYLLLIRDTLTGEPLMLAWVADPARH